MKKPYVVVVGGMNMDIFGMPNKKSFHVIQTSARLV